MILLFFSCFFRLVFTTCLSGLILINLTTDATWEFPPTKSSLGNLFVEGTAFAFVVVLVCVLFKKY